MHTTNLDKDHALNFGDLSRGGTATDLNKFGDSGSALDFQTSGYAKLPDEALNTLTDFSIAFWYKEKS